MPIPPPPPAYDDLLRVLPPTSALLYRLVWRLSQRDDANGQRGCRIPLRDLAFRLRVAPSTILLHLRALVRAGYVLDLTPQLRPASHLYRISDRPVRPSDPPLRVFHSRERS